MLIDALAALGATIMIAAKYFEGDTKEVIIWACVSFWAWMTFFDRRFDDRL